jgi:CHAT domain
LFQPLTELGALVVGNPKLPSGITEQWGWNNLPLAEQEAAMVSELLSTSSSPAMAPSGPTLLVGRNATKQAVLARIATADCIHFSTHVSWQLSAIVLAPPPSPTVIVKILIEPIFYGFDFSGGDANNVPLSKEVDHRRGNGS